MDLPSKIMRFESSNEIFDYLFKKSNEVTYKIKNSKIILKYDDLQNSDLKLLVCPEDTNLSMGVISKALIKFGGEQIAFELGKYRPIKLGNIVVTTSANLESKYIFHVAIEDGFRKNVINIDIISEVTKKCLIECNKNDLTSISFPALGIGNKRLPVQESSIGMMEIILKVYLMIQKLKYIHFVFILKSFSMRQKTFWKK